MEEIDMNYILLMIFLLSVGAIAYNFSCMVKEITEDNQYEEPFMAFITIIGLFALFGALILELNLLFV